ncbi:P22 phage major capsid protein family protein [Streptomyces blastmyceticus]
MVAKSAAELLKAELVLGRLVFRDAGSDFEGGVGDTVRVRIPKVVEAQSFTGSTSAVTTSVAERVVPVTLSAHGMNGVQLSAKDMDLNVENFGAQVLAPQVAGIAKFAEKAIAAQMQTVINGGTLEIDPSNPRKTITRAGSILDGREVGAKTRVLVVDPSVKEVLLNDPNLSSVADAGDPSALREALVGRLHGFNVFMSPYITGAVAMTRDAFAAAFRAPAKPQSVVGASQTDENGQGYASTWFMGFDLETRQERSIVEIFAGATVLNDQCAVGLKLGAQPSRPVVTATQIPATGGSVAGRADAGSHVLIHENGAVVGGALTDSKGAFSATAPSGWAAGSIHFVEVTSVAGGYSSEPAHTVVSVAAK